MDRSLNADDLRELDRLNTVPTTVALSPAPPLATLPAWFQRLVAEQATWLGIEMPAVERSAQHQAA